MDAHPVNRYGPARPPHFTRCPARMPYNFVGRSCSSWRRAHAQPSAVRLTPPVNHPARGGFRHGGDGSAVAGVGPSYLLPPPPVPPPPVPPAPPPAPPLQSLPENEMRKRKRMNHCLILPPKLLRNSFLEKEKKQKMLLMLVVEVVEKKM